MFTCPQKYTQSINKEVSNFFIQSENAAKWPLSYQALKAMFPMTYSYTSKENRMDTFAFDIGQEVFQGYPLKDDKVTIMSQQYIDGQRMYIVSQVSFLIKPLLIKKECDLVAFRQKSPTTPTQMETRLIRAGDYSVEPYSHTEPRETATLFKVTNQTRSPKTWYIVSQDMCSCNDFKYHIGLTGGMCKHRMACVVAGVIRL